MNDSERSTSGRSHADGVKKSGLPCPTQQPLPHPEILVPFKPSCIWSSPVPCQSKANETPRCPALITAMMRFSRRTNILDLKSLKKQRPATSPAAATTESLPRVLLPVGVVGSSFHRTPITIGRIAGNLTHPRRIVLKQPHHLYLRVLVRSCESDHLNNSPPLSISRHKRFGDPDFASGPIGNKASGRSASPIRVDASRQP